MNSIAYEIYYSSEDQAPRIPLSPEEVALALQRFPDDLQHRLSTDSSVSSTTSARSSQTILVFVSSPLSSVEINAAVAESADSLQLYVRPTSGLSPTVVGE